MKSITIDPLTRVEGDLKFEIDCDDNGVVTDSRSSGMMFRGFERLLIGKKPIDSLGITPRICGMCSAAHSYVCSNALRDLYGVEMPSNGYHVKNIILGVENVQNPFAHFYLLFAPDLANPKYEGKPSYEEVKKRFSIGGSSYRLILDVRNNFMNMMGMFGGRWPHTLAMQPGGTTQFIDDPMRLSYGYDKFLELKENLEQAFFGCSVGDWMDITSLSKLEGYLEDQASKSDLSLFITAGREFGLDSIGKGPENFMSCGGYDQPDGSQFFKSGFYDGNLKDFSQDEIIESVKYSHFEDEPGRHPFEGRTEPAYVDGSEKYSWIKAPRYQGKPVEVGPLARMIIDGDPLITELFQKEGASVFLRVLARFQEGVKTLVGLGEWIQAVEIGKPNINHYEDVESGEGVGFGPAGRGALGHWIKVKNGKISNYQVITPTTFNGSPKDDNDIHGPIESALLGATVENPKDPVEVYHVVRSFDPCLVCSCHVLKNKR